MKIKHAICLSIKKVKLCQITKGNIYTYKDKLFIMKIFFLLILMMIQFVLLICKKPNKYNKDFPNYQNNISNNNIIDGFGCINNKRKYDINFNYEDYDSEIITEKIKKDSRWYLSLREAKFINGIIRKNNLKNCLEIGVANGGSSILILNSLKDIKDSILVSLDLNKELFFNPNKLTGYRVNKYFPELSKNWKLYTGDQPHKFLMELNIKFDFLFLDSAHVSPGEILNFIEALPFLNENAIIVIHDLLWHFSWVKGTKFFPACISLLPTLYGDKIFMRTNNEGISNLGAVFLYRNQKEHYLDYFLLLLNFWEYIPKDNQIIDLRKFIIKYYKNKIYINIFDSAVINNKKANNKFKKYINQSEEKIYLVSLGTKWNITNI